MYYNYNGITISVNREVSPPQMSLHSDDGWEVRKHYLSKVDINGLRDCIAKAMHHAPEVEQVFAAALVAASMEMDQGVESLLSAWAISGMKRSVMGVRESVVLVE